MNTHAFAFRFTLHAAVAFTAQRALSPEGPPFCFVCRRAIEQILDLCSR
jgi:hypothetical protein